MEPTKVTRVIIKRLAPDADLLEELTKLVRAEGVRLGIISGIGALKAAAVGMFDQGKREYVTTRWDEEMEICALTGNVSVKDGQPFVHAHLVVSDGRARAFGGHLMPGNKIFVAEVVIVVLEGPELKRVPHEECGGLAVWARANVGVE